MTPASQPERLPSQPEPTLLDAGKAATRATVAAAASVGASLTLNSPWGAVLVAWMASFIATLHPTALQRRWDDWTRKSQSLFNKLRRQKVDVEVLRQDEEFADLTLRATEAALRSRSDEKRELLRNVLLNATEPSSRLRAGHFLRLLDDLDDLHILLLHFLDNPADYLARKSIPFVSATDVGRLIYESLGQLTGRAFQAFHDHDIFRLAIGTLTQRGLATFNPDVECRPASRFSTPLGQDFLRFLADPSPGDDDESEWSPSVAT